LKDLGKLFIRLRFAQQFVQRLANSSGSFAAVITDKAIYNVLLTGVVQIPILAKITNKELEQYFVTFFHFMFFDRIKRWASAFGR